MNAIDRTRPPETPDLPPFKIPGAFETVLGNGLSVVIVEDRRFPLVSARLGFFAGSKHEPAELRGLADTTAAVLLEGTTSRTAKQIADEMTALGGALRSDASADSLVITGNALAEGIEHLLDLVADVARNAVFPEEEVELRKQQSRQELLAELSDAGFIADEKINEVVFGPHPYARQEPTLKSIDRLDRAALELYCRAYGRLRQVERALTARQEQLLDVGQVQRLAGGPDAQAKLAGLGQGHGLAAVLKGVELDVVLGIQGRAVGRQRQQGIGVGQARLGLPRGRGFRVGRLRCGLCPCGTRRQHGCQPHRGQARPKAPVRPSGDVHGPCLASCNVNLRALQSRRGPRAHQCAKRPNPNGRANA